MQAYSRPMPGAVGLAPARQRDNALWSTAIAFALLLLWDATTLDLRLARLFGDTGGFGWREHWLTSGALHQGGRALAWMVAALLLVNVFKPLFTSQSRRERIWWLAVTLACVALISTLKRASATSCPWDLAEFGGAAHYVSHWRLGVADGGGGHCFPSGHAGAAFAFVSGFFALRRAYPRAARAWLAGVVIVGTLFGLGQLARGAHYASHTLWAAWVCWALCTGSARWLQR
ncbi:phosphatase PAP2 family protein [Roseateles sp. LYH14W]|uniref:Phosphatase PAP2 family protein n=1 Tax=Pelomonas parva TaxID=3299032 RepID=A0ABW7F0K9_9BURK